MQRGGEPSRPSPPRWQITVIVVLIVLFWVLGTVANALAPQLLVDRPLLLVALEPRNRYLLLTAGRVDLVPYLIWATFRRIASDPVYFALGAIYGDRSLRWLESQAGPRGVRVLRFIERWYARAARPMVFLFPGLIVCVLAGATGMRTRTFLGWNLAGTIAAVLVLRAFAQSLEEPVLAITDWVEANQTWLTVVTVGAVVAYLLWQRRRGGGELASIRELTEDG